MGKTPRLPVVYNFMKSHRRWGHDITMYAAQQLGAGKMKGSCMGWTEGILAGDYFLIQMDADHFGFFRITEIEYLRDPADMFKVKFDREEGEFLRFANEVFCNMEGDCVTMHETIAFLNSLPSRVVWDKANPLPPVVKA